MPLSLLRAVADLPEEALRDGLRRLHAAEFVYFTGLLPIANFLYRSPDFEYSFKHVLTQEVAYRSLTEIRRRAAHAAAGFALEDMNAGRIDEVVDLLAYHFGRSAADEKAVDYALLAAAKAQRRWANADRAQTGRRLPST